MPGREAVRTSLHRSVRVEHIMGTAISIHVVHADATVTAATRQRIDGCFAELREIDRVFSPYRDDSDITLLARGAIDLADADPRVARVHEECRAAELETAGLFCANGKEWFDPTGYVKGWSVENAARRHLAPLVADLGDAVAVGINAGGDMQLFTAPGAEWVWEIGIADPRTPGAIVARLDVVDGAVATSGSAERGHHIIDPRTGSPATGIVSATVVDDSLTRADLWATAAVVSGFDDRSWIARAGTRTGLLIADGGEVARWIGGTEVAVVEAPAPRGGPAVATR